MPIRRIIEDQPRARQHRARARAQRAPTPEPPFPPRDGAEVDNLHGSQRSLLMLAEHTSERMEALQKPGLLYSATLPPAFHDTYWRLIEVFECLWLMETRLEDDRKAYLTGHADLLRETNELPTLRRFVRDTEKWVGEVELKVREQARLVIFVIAVVVLVAGWFGGLATALW